MIQKIKAFLKTMNCTKTLAVLFLSFILYVGSVPCYTFLYYVKTAIIEHQSVSLFIETINGQYGHMLGMDCSIPLLRNKGTYIDFCGFMGNLLGQPSLNQTIKLQNGFLGAVGTPLSDSTINAITASSASLHQAQTEKGKHFLFVLAPSKTHQVNSYLPAGYHHTADESFAKLLNTLDSQNIPYLDLRESLVEDEISYEDAFFVTDHHWTAQTGFWAYGKILDKLEEMGVLGSVDTTYTAPENFNFDIYEDSFLGSSGKRVGKYYAGLDDFCLITPKFETEMSLYIEQTQQQFYGSFPDVAFLPYYQISASANNYYEESLYSIYGHSDRDLMLWRNEYAPQASRVMLIGDSYGNVPFSFMPLYFQACNELDMRHFQGDFTTHYDDFDPDIVIVLINSNGLGDTNSVYPFFQDGK